ncbi:hypothetical protein N7492_007420 [Penicillium capsulatum]|uniref:Uncharacterized protein n=1 Tax=Penicillium capsulatum TaxID=69766 RepID=A0A9W9I1Y7_9EURO|nr:hypothetical protein N7492_007420 [Penicillium capsulatum]KAJ6117256.1 hypothetical protein N7512_006981 [Penicillium capsulatum]
MTAVDSGCARTFVVPPDQAARRYSSTFPKRKLPVQSGRYLELNDFSVPVPAQNQPETPGKTRSVYIPNTLWTRLFAATVIIETVLTVAIENWVLISISNHLNQDGKTDQTTRVRAFLGLYIFALLYESVLCYDALRRQNTFQLAGLCICNLGLFIYGILQMKEIKGTIMGSAQSIALGNKIWAMYNVELILVPVFLGVGTVAMLFMTWRLRAEFSWSIYKTVSADLRMNRRFLTYQVYIALLKFDFFFIFGSQLQIVLALGEIDDDFIINIAMVPIAIVVLFLSAFFCRREKTVFLMLMMCCMSGILATIIKSLERMNSATNSDGLSSYRVSLTLFSSIAGLLIICSLINSVLCILNFHRGLKEHIAHAGRKQPGSEVGSGTPDVMKSRFMLH